MAKNNDYLEQLENEAIYILRETAAQFENPALLFSGGKDSIVLVHLALKAFRPGKFPFPLVHIDTGHNFPEAIAFRDYLVNKIGEKLIVASVEESITKYNLKETPGRFPSRNALQTYALLDAIQDNGFDACIGGARRDEEKARAKERIFSVRDDFGQWDPKLQRPELWDILNGKIKAIEKNNVSVDKVIAGENIVLHFENNIDISRGDTIVKKNEVPTSSNELKTWISWLDDSSLQIGKTYLLQHRFKTVRVKIQAINQKWNINDWEFVAADEIKLNDIAQVSIKTNQPLFYDAFAENPKSGNAILIDETSLNTVGALMFL
ncbi:predicted protein [Nematostella vectensis]|uniref:Sulfate adenylate transferase n=1 Tax=Nematostella vectensis TaxID=45351 RepID=A7TD47_NEMVE|nr:predicted protein [Nematostella vectensis]|eukprot:XP_001618108.1 hypothetical protein NEMVEDRAFT_v1g225506 [Nematostella vectensis]